MLRLNETTHPGPIVALPPNQGHSNFWLAVGRLIITIECLVCFCLQISQGEDEGLTLLSLHVVIRRAFSFILLQILRADMRNIGQVLIDLLLLVT